MVTTAYDQGDTRRLSVAFTDIAGTATDPGEFVARRKEAV